MLLHDYKPKRSSPFSRGQPVSVPKVDDQGRVGNRDGSDELDQVEQPTIEPEFISVQRS